MIPFLRDVFLKDFWLKLFSLAVAVLIWLTVWFALNRGASPLPPALTPLSFTPPDTRPFLKLPVTVFSSTEDAWNYKVIPQQVDVIVQGELKILHALHSTDIRVLVDVTGMGTNTEFMRRVEVSAPPGVSYNRIDPPQVQVVYAPKN